MANEGDTPKRPRAPRRRRPPAAATKRTTSARRSEPVTEASEDSFPASDPPAYTATTTGGPGREASGPGRRAGATPASSRGGRGRKKNEPAAVDPFAPAPAGPLSEHKAARPALQPAQDPSQQSWDNIGGPSPSAGAHAVPMLLAAAALVVLVAVIWAVAA